MTPSGQILFACKPETPRFSVRNAHGVVYLRTFASPCHAVKKMRYKCAMRTHRDIVNGLASGLRVLEAFREDPCRLTLAEVARRTGTTRAAARRYLLTLVDTQYAGYD